MHDSEIQSKLLARLKFTLALELSDDPATIALAWPSAVDGALMWDRGGAVELSQPAFDAALDAALWAYQTLCHRDGVNVRFITRPVAFALRGATPPPAALQFFGA